MIVVCVIVVADSMVECVLSPLYVSGLRCTGPVAMIIMVYGL